MAIVFTRERLHVGYRRRDWSDVWMELKGEINEEGEADFSLFKLTTGPKRRREPKKGEVHWHPHFDPQNCESKSPTERDDLQKQTLTDAWLYLAEKIPEKVKAMEKELHDPRFSRWQSWFEHAKKFKKTQMRNRKWRFRERRETAREADVPENEIERQVNDESTDESDSAYESEQGLSVRGRRPATPMGPPPRPKNNKRKAAANGGRGSVSHPQNKQRRTNPRMSGALGASRSQASGNSDGARDRTSTSDDESENQLFDSRPPEGLQDHTINAHNLEDYPTPSGTRRRGNSREQSQPPSNRAVQHNDNEEDQRRVNEVNGTRMTEEEAMDRARRESESVAPEQTNDDRGPKHEDIDN